ncbi:beta-glucosidase [Longispora fulva]|uniref:Beta-glucosidase n=1 Tax=Longispora fulva TaxID=619741 RepID=A0A8J7GIA8_9ACTN|nr:GH1 family beta-glucosidase [Longispora fulva]MBG6137197.1 beta-glucosidase [Longispora fulva]GIG61448.1 beta-glucosidase [Longispora fulva]
MSDWPEVPQFPADFRWGAATAAFQIEGSLHADGRGASIWDSFPTNNGDTAATATDSYRRWRDDVDLLSGLGANAYRFSIAWPRIQADGAGAPNRLGLDHYDRLVDELCARGIDPAVTLYHWDLPQALEDAGGWLNRDTAARFADYSAHVHARLGDRVKLWITHNEPFVHAAYGYTLGQHAPGRTLLGASFPAVHHLLLSHGLATAALRAQGATNIGITHNLAPVSPASDAPEDALAAARFDGWQNRVFCDPVLLGHYPDGLDDLFPGASDVIADGDAAVIGAPLDFLGVNYYNPYLVRASAASPLGFEFAEHEGVEHTAFGWPIVPAGLTRLLLELKDRYDLPPVYITENGASFTDTLADRDRIDYLAGHLTALRAAMDAGVDVRGYFCWSLLDNFEWAEGYSQRFGLVRVDFETGERTPRESYGYFRSLATR